jgi:hypothetical protein
MQDPPKFTQIWIFGLKNNTIWQPWTGAAAVTRLGSRNLFFICGKTAAGESLEKNAINEDGASPKTKLEKAWQLG